MEFYEIPDKCSVCGDELIKDCTAEGHRYTCKMDFYYAVCPECERISNVMCPECCEQLNRLNLGINMAEDGDFCCEYCGGFISRIHSRQSDIKHGILLGHQCDRHKRDIEEAETL